MIDRIESTKDRTAYTIVSADRQITDAAAEKKLKVISNKDFAETLFHAGAGAAREVRRDKLAPGEVDFWMKEFGLPE